MKPTHNLATAEQGGQRVEAGMEQRQAAEQQGDERRRHDPVIDAGAAGIAAHTNMRAALGLIAHDLPPASLSALSSSSSETRLAPCRMWWMKPAAAVRPMTAMPAYLPTPFQASTRGLILGLSGRPA